MISKVGIIVLSIYVIKFLRYRAPLYGGIPFLSIRTITDSADRSAAACFEENCRRASEIAAQVTHALFKRLAAGGPCLIAKGELP